MSESTRKRDAGIRRSAATVLILTAALASHVVAQSREFSATPDHALGLKEDQSASISFADVDGDGDLDVLVANGRHWPQESEVFINNGNSQEDARTGAANGYGRFTIAFPLADLRNTSYATPSADLDGDGDLDVVIAIDRAPNTVYLNQGGRFEYLGSLSDDPDVTRDAVLADFDGDGLPDVAVANRGGPNYVYLNQGARTFRRPACGRNRQ